MPVNFTQPPKSICIIRLSAIGDVCHMLPVIHTLQNHWPDCKITWIIGKIEASLVSDFPDVEFITFDKSLGLKAYKSLLHTLQGQKFDLLLHMQVALRASLISLMVKTPIKLGFDKARAHDYQWLFTNEKIANTAQQHVLDGFLAFLTAIGIDDHKFDWSIPIADSDTAFANNIIKQNQPALIINPCSSNRKRNWRNWTAANYAHVIKHATLQYNMQIILTGGNSQQENIMAEQIMRLSECPVENLVGKTSLKQLLALLKQAATIIAPDTGPAHMATVVGTPVIGLYASSNPLRTGPYLSQQHTVNKYPEALERYNNKNIRQARWGERVRNPNVMELIQTEDVIDKLDEIMRKQ